MSQNYFFLTTQLAQRTRHTDMLTLNTVVVYATVTCEIVKVRSQWLSHRKTQPSLWTLLTYSLYLITASRGTAVIKHN